MFSSSSSNLSATTDPYFPYVSMLLPGDGTNGAQNNTFLDSSTNNFTVTRYGNSTQGSFSPYGSNWSNFFNGSSAIYAAYNASLNVGNTTGSGGTVEFFYYATSLTSPRSQLFGVWTETSPGVYAGWTIDLNTSGDVFITNDGGGTTYGYGFTANTWNYCQFVFGNFGSGFVCKGYLNGVLKFTSSTLTHTNNNGAFYIGRRSDGNLPCNGYFSNFRVNTNNNLSTAVPTTPLTAISGTSLLTCQSNRFIDNSSNAFALTTVGSPTVQRFSPLSPTSPYSTTTIGGSAYFDGTGDYLSVPDSTSLELGSSDFTIECWIYYTGSTFSNEEVVGKGWSTGGYEWLFFTNSGNMTFFASSSGSSWDIAGGTSFGSIVKNEWTHYAVSRSGSSIRLFKNGVLNNTITTSASFHAGTSVVTIAAANTGSYLFPGYISDIRLIKGTALYTSAFTPPSAPLTAVSNTQLLMNMTNAGIYDAAMINDAETIGTAQISTSVSKFGTGSLRFDAGTNALYAPLVSPLLIGASENFTIECWVYMTALTNVNTIYNTGSSSEYLAVRGPGTTVEWSTTTVSTNFSFTFSTNTWYHIALTRSGGNTVKCFVNGTQAGSNYTYTNTVITTAPFRVGYYVNSPNSLNGYMDDFRITKGIARYTANFTPPTTAFPTQ